ncbi:tyrosinase family protein [Saccharothrix syringae]|uniref:Tyrosinase family protein n=1 Tax=Saccharothrix syringae TaxID=103733 RepID=A0A5Q0GYP1_SACSY|nr:tyrosinase family protein [Saccharothrix syringae]QFZ18983.1 tyrosinase family protein [Saccharothrix syringae]
MGTRKSVAALTAAEKADFVAAVKALKAQTTGHNYDWFVSTHMTYFSTIDDHNYAHRSPSFLPWHRQYLVEFENALKAINPAVDLPYWNWTANRSATGAPFTSDFMGGNGSGGNGPVTTGPFAGEARWRINISATSSTSLRRAIAVRGSLPTSSNVDTVMNVSTYDASPWSSASSSGMRNRVEGGLSPDLHGRVHNWVGGHMAQTDSPNDPVFFLHHCNIDRLWSRWQRSWGYGAGRYQPGGSVSNVVDVDEALQPFGVTVSSVLDHRATYTYA